jgi:hypothetical protein
MFPADTYTATAEDTFSGVVDELVMAVVDRQSSFQTPQSAFLKADMQVLRDLLQLTSPVFTAVGAVHVMRGHEKLESASGQL